MVMESLFIFLNIFIISTIVGLYSVFFHGTYTNMHEFCANMLGMYSLGFIAYITMIIVDPEPETLETLIQQGGLKKHLFS